MGTAWILRCAADGGWLRETCSMPAQNTVHKAISLCFPPWAWAHCGGPLISVGRAIEAVKLNLLSRPPNAYYQR